jgi:hypothetical protein
MSSPTIDRANADCQAALRAAEQAVARLAEPGAGWAAAERAEAAVVCARHLQERFAELLDVHAAAVAKKKRDVERSKAAFEARRVAALVWADGLDVAAADRPRLAELRAAIAGTVLD